MALDHSSPRETDAAPELPSLRPGVRLLETADASRRQSIRVVQALTIDHLLLNSGYVEWVDAGGHASTQPLTQLVPSDRFLDRITVARAFTPYQHASLVEGLTDRVSKQTALVVCPALDHLYQTGDCHEEEGEAMHLRAIARLSTIARSHEVPVLVTRTGDNEVSEPVVRAADERIEYERTRYGPRFSGEGFETLVYPVGHGQVQTTIAFWVQVLTDRLSIHSPSAQELPSLVG